MVQSSDQLDSTFAALSDPTRRGILERLGTKDSSISELAATFGMSLTGIKKHVRILERAEMVTTEKVGRVRTCRMEPAALSLAEQWFNQRRTDWEHRLDRLGAHLRAFPEKEPK